MKNPYTLLTPGPVSFPFPVKKTLSEPSLHHRSLSFQKIFKETQNPLQSIFQTKEFVLTLTSSGTGAMEAAVTNTLSPQDSILCICIGKFGERWKEIGQSYGMQVSSLEAPPGEFVPAERVKKHLQSYPETKAVFMQACETSTATDQPIEEISAILKQYPQTLLIVDGITGIGAMKLPMDSLGIDVLIAGSQKTFMIPTGIAFIALSQKAWEFQKTSTCPRYYFDLKKEIEAQKQGQTIFSSNVTLIRALSTSLNYYKEKGLEGFILRCHSLAKSAHVFCQNFSLSLFSKNPSSSVTAIQMPEGISGIQIKKHLEEEHNIIIATGQGSLKDQIIRIGHLGPITNKDFLRGLRALGMELNKKRHDIYTIEKLDKALTLAKNELENHSEIF